MSLPHGSVGSRAVAIRAVRRSEGDPDVARKTDSPDDLDRVLYELLLDEYFRDKAAAPALARWLKTSQHASVLKGCRDADLAKRGSLARSRLLSALGVNPDLWLDVVEASPRLRELFASIPNAGPKTIERFLAAHGPVLTFLAFTPLKVTSKKSVELLSTIAADIVNDAVTSPHRAAAIEEPKPSADASAGGKDARKMQLELNDAKKKLEVAKRQVSDLTRENQRLQTANSQLEGARSQIVKLQEIVDNQTAMLGDIGDDKKDLATHLRAEEKKVSELRDALDEARATSADLAKEREGLADDLARVRSQLDTAQASDTSPAMDDFGGVIGWTREAAARETRRYVVGATEAEIDGGRLEALGRLISALDELGAGSSAAITEDSMPASHAALDASKMTVVVEPAEPTVAAVPSAPTVLVDMPKSQLAAIDARNAESELEAFEADYFAAGFPDRFLIDGHNVILRKDFRRQEREGREWLQSVAPLLHQRSGSEIRLFFDTKFSNATDEYGDGVRVTYCPKAQGGADACIIQEIETCRDESLLVCSDDYKHIIVEADAAAADGRAVQGITGAVVYEYLRLLERAESLAEGT